MYLDTNKTSKVLQPTADHSLQLLSTVLVTHGLTGREILVVLNFSLVLKKTIMICTDKLKLFYSQSNHRHRFKKEKVYGV